MTRPFYAPTSNYRAGIQTEYTGGLTYFPDNQWAIQPTPLGEWYDDAAVAGGTAIAGPVGGVATSLARRWFGGSAVDQQRQERVNYVVQHAAQNNNVNAMRIILGAPSNVSGNERTMWEQAYTDVKNVNPQVVAEAEALGSFWLHNSGDTASNYPRLREYIRQGSSVVQRVTGVVSEFFTPDVPAASTPGGVAGPGATSGGVSPMLLLGGAAVAALVLFGRRRS